MAKIKIDSSYDSVKIARELNRLLASTENFYLIYKHYHWNIVSDEFYSLHLLFDKHADELHQTIDVIAERVRQMGEIANGRMQSYDELSILNMATQETDDEEEVLNHLLENHNKYIAYLEELVEMTGREKDYATADLLTGFLQTQQQQRWFVAANKD